MSERVKIDARTEAGSLCRGNTGEQKATGIIEGHPVLRLQGVIGNRAMQRLLLSEISPYKDQCRDSVNASPDGHLPASFEARGKTEEAPSHFRRQEQIRDPASSDERPSAFVSNGRRGDDAYYMAGGRGGRGHQDAGTTQVLQPPQIDQLTSGGETTFCFRQGTGIVHVVRSYTGVRPGDQGPAGQGTGRWFITPAAVARINLHEDRHIAESQRIYSQTIAPMEERLGRFVCPQSRAGRRSGLEDYLGWDESINEFERQDEIRNRPNGSFDQEDSATPPQPEQRTNVSANGVTYDVYMKMPGESLPP